MKIISIDDNGLSARCEACGVERVVGLLMLQRESLTVGDYVMISLGQVMQKVSAQEAAVAWGHYDEIFAMLDSEGQ